MLNCIGSVVVDNVKGSLSCDVCNCIECIQSSLSSFATSAHTTIQHKRRHVGKLSEELSDQVKSSLLTERDAFMSENPKLRFVGPSVVCPTCYIESMCEAAHRIQSEDGAHLLKLNSVLRSKFFRIICNFISQNTSSKIRRLM